MAINSVTGEHFKEFSLDGKHHFVEIGGIVRRFSIEREAEERAEVERNETMYAVNCEAARRDWLNEQAEWVPRYRAFIIPKGMNLTPAEYSIMFVNAFPNSPAAERYAVQHPQSKFAEDYYKRNPDGYVRDNYQHSNDK